MNREMKIGTRGARARRCGLMGAALFGLVLAGCSDDDSLVDDTRPVGDIFAEAEGNLENGSYISAAKGFDDVERLYPYSSLAKTAMILSAESYYRAGKYEEARLAAQRYLEFFPSDSDAAYAQYIIGLSYYDQISDVGRDQGDTLQAAQALREVVERYPNSEYARDARLKYDLTQDNLAGKEMQIGRYYLGRKHYISAINRFRRVVELYSTTSQVPEALHRLVESYLGLGLTKEAQNAAAVLGYNYPGSEWYVDSYALLTGQRLGPEIDEESWLSRNFRKVVYGDQF